MDIDQHPGSIVLLRKRPLSQVASSVQQTHKHFLRKTAKGRVVKVLREHYLRPDIPCGSLLCDACDEFYGASLRPTLATDEEDDARSKVERPLLSVKGRPAWKGAARGHYLVLDTNVVLHQVNERS
jgi:exosome complex exonuclease DIS3/RRP44